MSPASWLYAVATVLGAVGMWLLLPRPGERLRWVGAAMAMVSLGLILSQLTSLGDVLSESMFIVLGSVTVISAAAAVTFRNPVYCAIWFAMMLLGTAGLFMVQGAHFLSVATIVVYAGAILVTLLFVLMLANPRGDAPYDRVSWEGPLSATAGIVLVGMLTMTLGGVFKGGNFAEQLPSELVAVEEANAALPAAGNEVDGVDSATADTILDEAHSANLGARMFGAHLVSIEVAGVLLLAALVGAVAIIAHSRASAAETPKASSTQAPSTNGRAGA